MIDSIYTSAGIVAFSFWLSYIIEPGRILGFIGRWTDKYYDKDRNRYAAWLMPFACIICRVWWMSMGFIGGALIYGLENRYLWLVPFFSHVMARLLAKKLY